MAGKSPARGVRPPEFRLIVDRPDGKTEIKRIDDGPVSIGRGGGCGVVVPENSVSRNHCIVFPLAGTLYLKDLGSANGTFVNGELISQRKLVHGDLIHIGSVRMRVVMVDPSRVQGLTEAHQGGVPRWLVQPQETSVVAALGALLAGSKDLASTAKAALGLLHELIELERSFLLLVNAPLGGAPSILASVFRDQGRSGLAAPSSAIVEVVLDSGEPFYSNDASRHPDGGREAQGRAVLCAPIEHHGEVLGVLYADGPARSVQMDEEVKNLFEGIASQSALSIAEASERVKLAPSGGPVFTVDPDEADWESLGEDVPIHVETEDDALPAEPPDARELELRALSSQRLVDGLVHDSERLTAKVARSLKVLKAQAREGSLESQIIDSALRDAARVSEMAEIFRMSYLLQNGGLEPVTETVDVARLLKLAQARASADSSFLHVTLNENACDRTVEALSDPELLARVVDALVTHTIERASPGGQVSLGARRAIGTVEVAIAERGGPPQRAGERPRLVASWSSSSAPEPSLFGAWLSFCRLAIEIQGGKLRLEGDGEGTQWIISLPARGDGSMESTNIEAIPTQIKLLRKVLTARGLPDDEDDDL